MCVEGSQPIVLHLLALKRGFLAQKGISSTCDCLQPLATVSPPPCLTTGFKYQGVMMHHH